MFGMDTGYWLYMNEAEGTGLVNTRQGRLNQLGRHLRSMGYKGKVVPAAVFYPLLEKYKLNDITESEVHDIERMWL
jgi:hypothetical protein